MTTDPVSSIISSENDHYRFMKQAINEARYASEIGEIPVGAVITYKNRIIARGHNQVELLSDPTAHAEMIALTAAFEHLQEKYLQSCTMYVTLEPCPMCAGALVWAKLDKLVIAAQDEHSGACGSLFNIASNRKLNHQIEIVQGILEQESEDLLTRFFRQLRQ
ncbi:MAG: tRNA adenosine(34) deaminase TadA [Balneolales bacterium]